MTYLVSRHVPVLFAILTVLTMQGCAGVKPAPAPAERPPFVVCGSGCSADFDVLARGERGVVVRSLNAQRSTRGELTKAGEQRAQELSVRLAALGLRAQYGCPGCADGPVASVKLSGSPHVFDPYTLDQVEVEAERNALAAVVQLFSDVEAPLSRCESNAWVRPVAPCEPFPTFGP